MFELLNLLNSSSDEESDYELEQVYQHQEDYDIETSLNSDFTSTQGKELCGCKTINILTNEEEIIKQVNDKIEDPQL